MTQEEQKNLSEHDFLKTYDPSQFERPSVTVDTLIFTISDEGAESYRRLSEKSLKLLMIKRGNHPYKGHWALPGGFVEMNENLEEAALRELKEETGLDKLFLEQLYTWGDVGRDPRTRIISTSYMALADSARLPVTAGDDADAAAWFSVSYKLIETQKIATQAGHIHESIFQLTLRNGEEAVSAKIRTSRTVEGNYTDTKREIIEAQGLAFDHGKIIAYGVERLRSKIAYTDIAFHLMPERFTLTQLQKVYEVILDRELLKANFRRKIAPMVLETGSTVKDAGHRPSRLYRYNPDWKRVEE
jgi:8-oxo-dGTP diphosphatase